MNQTKDQVIYGISKLMAEREARIEELEAVLRKCMPLVSEFHVEHPYLPGDGCAWCEARRVLGEDK